MNKATIEAIKDCKELKGKTVSDICSMPEFMKNLSAYIKAQQEERDAARATLAKGMRLPAHPIDRVFDRLKTTEQFRDEYMKIINRVSDMSKVERLYVDQLGTQAYQLTVAQIIVKEHPELESELIPKAKAN